MGDILPQTHPGRQGSVPGLPGLAVPAPVQLPPPSHLHPHVLSITGHKLFRNIVANIPCQVIFYIGHSHLISGLVTDPILSSQAPVCSLLIYNPARRGSSLRMTSQNYVRTMRDHLSFRIKSFLWLDLTFTSSDFFTAMTSC